jgi:hypothetical protein
MSDLKNTTLVRCSKKGTLFLALLWFELRASHLQSRHFTA